MSNWSHSPRLVAGLGSVPIALVTARLIHLGWRWIMAEQFWLSDVQWAVIEPLLPQLGGKPRVDDRRVISGILHRYRQGLTLAGHSGRVWSAHHAVQPVRPLEREGYLAGSAGRRSWPAKTRLILAMVDSTAVRAHRSAAGAKGGSSTRQSAARAAGPRPRSTPSPTAQAASTR